MISNEQARAIGLWFNYSKPQWKAISDEIKTIQSSKEAFDYWGLLEAANTYLDEHFLQPRERAAEFRRIRQMAEHLRLTVAGSFSEDHSHVNPIPQKCLASIEKIESWAKYYEAMFRLRGTAKQTFYMAVLECWGDAGGAFARSNRDGSPSGPTVRYFEAAVTPVMGDEAPRRDAIVKAILRHRAHDQEMRREIERLSVGCTPASLVLRELLEKDRR